LRPDRGGLGQRRPRTARFGEALDDLLSADGLLNMNVTRPSTSIP